MTEKQLPTFTQWLARMTKNQSAIGDLARDVAQDTNFPAQGERVVYIDYLTKQNASAGAVSAFNHAWANYQTALKRAQETGAGSSSASPAQAERKPETVAPYHEWTDEEVLDHDKWYSAQGETVAAPGGDRGQATALRVLTTPVAAPCEDCGSSKDTKQWTIPGIGQGVLCESCLKNVVDQINAALGA